MIWLAAAIGALCALRVAADDNPGKDSGALFEQLDTNKDGVLTSDEIPQDKKGLFDRLVRVADKDGDGKLSGEEFAAGLERKPARPDAAGPRPNRPEGREGRPPERIFKRLDTNGDGKVTLSEVPEERRPMFERLLKRAKKEASDGLTRDEFVAALEGAGDPPGRPEKPQRPGRPGQGPPPGALARGGLFALLDTDHDHKLSSDEMSAAPEVLKKLDKDGDGSVSADELMTAIGPPPDADK